MKGWYSIVQYCPDSSRLEAANVGVVLLCPERLFFGSKVASGNDRIRKFFGATHEALQRIEEAKKSIDQRLQSEKKRIHGLDDLMTFLETRGNDFLLTPPRVTRVDAPEHDLERLFKELVGGRAIGERIERPRQGASVVRHLHEVFSRDQFREIIRHDVTIEVPVVGQSLRATYAYNNGTLNAICAQTIHYDDDQTLTAAMKLAVKSDLLQKHNMALVTVALPSVPAALADVTDRVEALFDDYNIKHIHEYELQDFANEVLAVAHH